MEQKAGLIAFKKLLKLIDDHPQEQWNLCTVAQCPFITPDVLDAYSKEEASSNSTWDMTPFWKYISGDNTKVNIKTIKKYPDKPWDSAISATQALLWIW